MAAANPSAATEPADKVLVITRTFDAPRSLVFQAWTQKEHLDHWCVPRGFTILDSEGELRPGGRWRCRMRSPDGAEYRVGGTYREIVQDELLVFTHAWESEDGKPGHETLVTLRFADQAGKTRTHVPAGDLRIRGVARLPCRRLERMSGQPRRSSGDAARPIRTRLERITIGLNRDAL